MISADEDPVGGEGRITSVPCPVEGWGCRGSCSGQSSHLWRLPLPARLEVGGHTARVQAVDPSGREFEEFLHFEVVAERPQPFFRKELFAPQG